MTKPREETTGIGWTVYNDQGIVATGDRARDMAACLLTGVDPDPYDRSRGERVWCVDGRTVRAEVLR